MTPENEKVFYDRFPLFFEKRNMTAQQSCMCWGICISDGWGDILMDLCEKIEKHCDETGNTDFRFEQIKEKFGLLRIYTDGGDETIWGYIDEAEALSGVTCEETGKPGKRSNVGGWIKTLCEEARIKLSAEADEQGW